MVAIQGPQSPNVMKLSCTNRFSKEKETARNFQDDIFAAKETGYTGN